MWFAAMFVVVVVATRAMYTTQFVDYEMWAEAGSNFYAAAHLGGWHERLFALDFGYVPLLPRLIALLTWALGVPPRWVPVAYGNAQLAVIAACSACICLPTHRRLIRSDLCRALFCLGILLFPTFELRTLTNVAYFLAFPALYTLFEARGALWPRGETAFRCAVLALAILSKPFFLAFVPMAVLAGGLWGRRSGQCRALALSALAAAAVQLVTILVHLSPSTKGHPHVGLADVPFLSAVLGSLGAGAVGLSTTMPVNRLADAGGRLGALTLVGVTVAFIAACWRARRHPTRLAMLLWPGTVVAGAVLGNLCINAASQMESFRAWLGPDLPFEHMTSRHVLITAAALAVAGATVICCLAGSVAPLALFAWLGIARPFGFQLPPRPLAWPVVGFSQWGIFAPWNPNGRARLNCVPLDPAPWIVSGTGGGTCEILVAPANIGGAPSLPHIASAGRCFVAPTQAATWTVDTVGVFLGGADAERPVRWFAYDAANNLLGVVAGSFKPARVLTYLRFATPVTGIARICADAATPLTLAYQGEQPAWFWFGRREGR